MRAALLLLAGLAACGEQVTAPPIEHLDRPTDVSFGCVSIESQGEQLAAVALPTSACASASAAAPDAGSGDAGTAVAARQLVFVAETTRGDVSVADISLGGQFIDSDKFAPGLNGIPVGRLPSGLATSANGCHAVVANSGSCDLSLIHVANAFLSKSDAVERLTVSSTHGRIAARPTAIVAPPSQPAGTRGDCSSASGYVYVAFAACNLVARVDLATGAVLDGVRYRDGAAPEIVGPDVTCPNECNAAELDATSDTLLVADAGVSPDAGNSTVVQTQAHPVTLEIERDGSQLYVGAHDSTNLLIIGLVAGVPTAVRTLPLEGAGGIARIATTGNILLGNGGVGGTGRFVYAIGKDQAIHVVNVKANQPPVECDTQIDRRYLHTERRISVLQCFPVGSADNPPRRAGARGPGIRLPRGVLPLDVQFIQQDLSSATDNPAALNGIFAVVTALGPVPDNRQGRGLAYYINVSDNAYEDFEMEPGRVDQADIALALPHTIRDSLLNRKADVFEGNAPTCVPKSYLTGTEGPPRLAETPLRPSNFVYNDTGTTATAAYAPSLHRVLCSRSEPAAEVPGWELDTIAPPEVRSQLFTDLERIGERTIVVASPVDEQIVVSWEGPLAFSAQDSTREGGRLRVGDGVMTLQADGALLCSLGAETGDVVELVGCSGDADCNFGETCVVHPDAGVTTAGMCMPKDRALELTTTCRAVLTAQRRYTAVETADDHLVFVPRPSVLYASPIGGCSSDAQCATIEDELLTAAEAAAGSTAPTLARHTYSCAVEPSMGGPARCITTCRADADCDEGTSCDLSSGRCIYAPLPPGECVGALQRYEVRAGDAFSIVSSNGEYRSRQVRASDGRCVPDESASPLWVNRFHRVEPLCTDLSATATGPNPCVIPDLWEPLLNADGQKYDRRPAYGIRVRGPGLTFDVTDVAIPLPGHPGVLYSPIVGNFGIGIRIAGGFTPLSQPLTLMLPERIRKAPDGSLYIVDSGDIPFSFVHGQVRNLNQSGVPTTITLR